MKFILQPNHNLYARYNLLTAKVKKMTNSTQGDASVEALGIVKNNIATAAADAGRDNSDVELVAVTKTFGAEHILPVIMAGQKVCGENRVQESLQKWPALKQQFSDLELHLIGPLQSNKVRDAVGLFDVIQTVDRPKLARVLANEMAAQDKRVKLFIQINTGSEPQKAGALPDQADQFIAECLKDYELEIVGLMCIPPFDQDASDHFTLLKEIAERNGLSGLSMGMSSDYQAAVHAGATHVRVGSAIFGARG